jgi:uncharacterized protein (TIGR03084 family)
VWAQGPCGRFSPAMVTGSAPVSPSLTSFLDDLAAEHEALDERVAGLAAVQWLAPTPAEGWSIADAISHLTYFDASATLALSDEEGFAEHVRHLLAHPNDGLDVELGRSVPPEELVARWRTGRATLTERAAVRSGEAASGGERPSRVPWYGPAMSLNSFVTARLMETWAHGQDVADALGLPPIVTPRLRHVIHIGVAARPYAFRVHDIEDPGDPIRVRTHNPTDESDIWTWGLEDAGNELSGSAISLALVFTQRRHPDDTDVRASGSTAERFLSVAQAFAGPAGPGRPRRPAS